MAVLPAIIIVVLVAVVDEMVTAHEIHCTGSVHNVWLTVSRGGSTRCLVYQLRKSTQIR